MINDLYNTAISLRDQLMELLPQILISLVVLGIGYIAARLIKFLILRLVKYVSRLVNQRFGQINIDQSAPFVGLAFFWLVMIATFILISNILKLAILTKGLEIILVYSPNVIAAILIVFVAIVFGKFISKTILSLGTQVGFKYGNTLGKIAQFLILLSATIIAIDQLGIEVTFLINMMNITMGAIFFAAAFAFGLGARTSVSNILAAFYIRKMYKEGDYIRIGDVEGRITKIDATVVKIDTESEQYSIPAKIFNESQSVLIKKK